MGLGLGVVALGLVGGLGEGGVGGLGGRGEGGVGLGGGEPEVAALEGVGRRGQAPPVRRPPPVQLCNEDEWLGGDGGMSDKEPRPVNGK